MTINNTPALTASRASSLVGAIGINLHLQSSQSSAYDVLTTTTITADLNMLGVSIIRDEVYDPALASAVVLARYAALAKAGFKFDLCVGGSNSDLATAMAGLDDFARANPGALRYVEGPNEINYFPFSYAGLTGQVAAIAFQRDLYSAVHADPLLAGVKVIDFTGGGGLLSNTTPAEPAASISDFANTHIYPASGDPPAWYVPAIYTAQYGGPIAGPYVITEAGYNSDSQSTYGVSEDVQAKQTLDLLLDAAQSGSVGAFLYEAFDEYSDPTFSLFDNHWGLFHADGSPKPVATALSNISNILADSGAGAKSFSPDSLGISVTGLPYFGHSWLLEKSSGVFDLVLWAEPNLWSASSHAELLTSGAVINVNFTGILASARIFDPLQSNTAVSTVSHVSQVTLTLTDHPEIVELRPSSNNPLIQPSISIITGNRDGGVTLAGSSTANSTVTVSDTAGGLTTVLGTATTSNAGAWTLTNHIPFKSSLINSYTVSASDSAGNMRSMAGSFLLASTGVDTLTGTAGISDVFAIMSFKGSDVISGFEPASLFGAVHDTIDLSGRGITSFSQLRPMISGSSSAIISIGSGKTVTLTDVAASSLTPADFRFS